METSLLAYEEIKATGTDAAHHVIILNVLKKLSCGCNKEISINCELSYHQVARRTKELLNKGKILIKESKKTSFAKTKVTIYQLSN